MAAPTIQRIHICAFKYSRYSRQLLVGGFLFNKFSCRRWDCSLMRTRARTRWQFIVMDAICLSHSCQFDSRWWLAHFVSVYVRVSEWVIAHETRKPMSNDNNSNNHHRKLFTCEIYIYSTEIGKQPHVCGLDSFILIFIRARRARTQRTLDAK